MVYEKVFSDNRIVGNLRAKRLRTVFIPLALP